MSTQADEDPDVTVDDDLDDEADDETEVDLENEDDDSDEDESDSDDDGTGPRKPAGRKNAGGTGRDEDKTPEQLKAELDKVRGQLSKSRAQQTRWKNRALEAAKAGKPAGDDGKEPTAADKRAVKAVVSKGGTDADAREKGEERGLSREDVLEMIAEARAAEAQKAAERYKPVAIRSEAKDLLTDAGYKFGRAEDRDRRLDRALKLIDMEQVELDDDGTVLGLEDEIDRLKDDWPELFADEDAEEEPPVRKPAGRRPARRINGRTGRAARSSTREMSASEGQLAYLRGHVQS